MDDKVKDTKNLGDYIIILDERDNVGTALKYIPAGKYFWNKEKEIDVAVREPIKAQFKVSLGKIKKGEYIYKYGNVIGLATKDINLGDKVHIENTKSRIRNE